MNIESIAVSTSIPLTPAESNTVDTQHLARHVKACFVRLGGLLKANKENAWWSQSGFETWRDYVEQLGIGGQSTASRLIAVYKLCAGAQISEKDVLEIGLEKMKLLLPLANKGGLTADVIELAKASPKRDLMEFLGLKVPHNDSNHSVTCSRCGEILYGCKYISKDKTNEPNPS